MQTSVWCICYLSACLISMCLFRSHFGSSCCSAAARASRSAKRIDHAAQTRRGQAAHFGRPALRSGSNRFGRRGLWSRRRCRRGLGFSLRRGSQRRGDERPGSRGWPQLGPERGSLTHEVCPSGRAPAEPRCSRRPQLRRHGPMQRGCSSRFWPAPGGSCWGRRPRQDPPCWSQALLGTEACCEGGGGLGVGCSGSGGGSLRRWWIPTSRTWAVSAALPTGATAASAAYASSASAAAARAAAGWASACSYALAAAGWVAASSFALAAVAAAQAWPLTLAQRGLPSRQGMETGQAIRRGEGGLGWRSGRIVVGKGL